MLSSSRQVHDAKEGGREARKLADMSRARRVELICGSVVERYDGREFGELEPPINRCVVPV